MFMISRKRASVGVFTDQPEYWFSGFKTTASGGADEKIANFSTVTGTNAADFNATTGVWTCPASGYYMLESRTYGPTVYTVPNGTAVYINGAQVAYSFGQTTGGQNSALPCSCIHIANITAGQTAHIYQDNVAASQAQFNIIGLHTNYLFRANSNGTGVGDNSSAWLDSGGWSAAALEYTANWAGCFDPVTGDFTCPVTGAGRWVFYARGPTYFRGAGAIYYYAGIFHNETQVARSQQYCSGTDAQGSNPMMVVLDLADGDKVNVRQYNNIIKNGAFGGFRLKNATPAWCAYDVGASGTGVGTTYANYSLPLVSVGDAFNPVTGEYTAPASGPHWAYSSAVTNALLNPTVCGTAHQFNGAQPDTSLNVYGENVDRHHRTGAGGSVAPITAGQAIRLRQNHVQMAYGTFCGFKVVGNNS